VARKLVAVITVIAMALSIIVIPQGETQAADVSYEPFVFQNEGTTMDSARITTDELVNLEGTLNVQGSEITYTIEQILDPAQEVTPGNIGNSRTDVSNNVYIDGSNISIFNLQLFPGMNRITFKGTQGYQEVYSTYYIEYRDGPVLYNLTASLDGNNFPLKEEESTVVYSPTTNGDDDANISISGTAPNSQNVTVNVNGNSWTFPVNSSNGYQFFASPITVERGKNLVTISVTNANQVVETTRELTFYNGQVTYYDVQIYQDEDPLDGGIQPGDNPASLEYHPNYSVSDVNILEINGRVVVPNAAQYYNDSLHPDPTNYAIDYAFEGDTSVTGTVYAAQIAGMSYEDEDPFFIFDYTIDVPSTLDYDEVYELSLSSDNHVNVYLNTGNQIEGTDVGDLTFSLRNANQAYIHDVQYLPGYSSPSATPVADGYFDNQTGREMDGADIFSMPIGVEVLIGNADQIQPADASLHISELVEISRVVDVNGIVHTYTEGSPNNTYEYSANILPNTNEKWPVVTRTVNGQTQQFLRVILEITKLPNTGTQELTFELTDPTLSDNSTVLGQVSNEQREVSLSLVYGPFAQFSGLYDGMRIQDDTTQAQSDRLTRLIDTTFKEFEGSLTNVTNQDQITYEDNPALSTLRSVSFYINNTQIDLQQNPAAGSSKGDFIIEQTVAMKERAFDALVSGENTFRFYFRTSNNLYEKTLRVYLIPTNLPQIPAPNTDGVFPYSFNATVPNPNDPNFTLNGGIYTTRQSKMNVFGTFDFIDLGSNPTAKIGAMDEAAKQNYILRIVSNDYDVTWSLDNQFVSEGATINNGRGTPPNLNVTYVPDGEYFTFRLLDQDIPEDGSTKIYNISVYNNGLGGPRATYRLEVDPTAIAYTLVRPLLPEKRIVNSNFVELIVHANGADSMLVDGEEAEKINYVDGVTNYNGAFRYVVTDLRENRDTEIEFTIIREDEEITDSISVRYEPTNIPGAQYMEEMGNGFEAFDDAIELDFERGTTLIRRDFNVPEQLKNQVFSGHKILMAIANPHDGVVDRHEFENVPANYDQQIAGFGARFRASFPNRFSKASSVYWIDAGLADDPDSGAYDPITIGADPYQFASSNIPSYDDRPANRELIPSIRGTLTLAYNADTRQAAGATVTVFRYDPVSKYWENLGGIVDAKNNTIEIPFDRFGYYVVGKLDYSFIDITQHHYARNFTEAIFAKGVMNPISFGEFGTDYYVTRGEFTTMLVKALDIPLDYDGGNFHFDDVPNIINPDALWDFRYIETAARRGIINGTRPRVFEPGSYLTREQAAYILAVSLDMKMDTNTEKVKATLAKTFQDFSDTTFAYYFQPAIAAIAKEGYISGSPIDPTDPKAGYVFEPKANLTRADAAIIIAKMLADEKMLPDIY